MSVDEMARQNQERTSLNVWKEYRYTNSDTMDMEHKYGAENFSEQTPKQLSWEGFTALQIQIIRCSVVDCTKFLSTI